MLIHYQLTQEDYRKKFHSGTQTSMETASQYLARLALFFDNWIRLSKIKESFDGLRELIMVEKFLHSCPMELALFIRERSPSDKKQLLELRRSLPPLGLQLEEVISHSSLTAIPMPDRIINPYLTDPIMSPIGIKIREKVCVTYVDSPAIER